MAKLNRSRGVHCPRLSERGDTPDHSRVAHKEAFGYPRDFLGNQHVYLVISPRAGGLSIGINVNPTVNCNLHCLYCEVDRSLAPRTTRFDASQMASELTETLELACAGKLRQHPHYASLPEDLLQVRHVALSGDGEPTLSKHFVEAVEAVVHVRALRKFPFFKIVLLTNSTALKRRQAQEGMRLLTRADEVWAKLDGGTQEYLDKVNRTTVPIETLLSNILELGRKRPVVIQSLFPAINGMEPSASEIKAYAQRLNDLKDAGAEISLVQIYSATRPMPQGQCTHLSLKSLLQIARTVREATGLRTEVY